MAVATALVIVLFGLAMLAALTALAGPAAALPGFVAALGLGLLLFLLIGLRAGMGIELLPAPAPAPGEAAPAPLPQSAPAPLRPPVAAGV